MKLKLNKKNKDYKKKQAYIAAARAIVSSKYPDLLEVSALILNDKKNHYKVVYKNKYKDEESLYLKRAFLNIEISPIIILNLIYGDHFIIDNDTTNFIGSNINEIYYENDVRNVKALIIKPSFGPREIISNKGKLKKESANSKNYNSIYKECRRYLKKNLYKVKALADELYNEQFLSKEDIINYIM